MTLTPSETVLILRRRMKLTQDEFGKLLEVTGKTVQYWELGRTPKAKVMDRIEILKQRQEETYGSTLHHAQTEQRRDAESD